MHEVLPPGMAFEWTEINYMQIDAAKNIWNNLIFPLAVVFVFLVLAAQYESWALPLAVILVVPMCILGSLTGVWRDRRRTSTSSRRSASSCWSAWRARTPSSSSSSPSTSARKAGLSRREATLEACKLRLRPILMTSFAFILGVVPLLVGHGAGAEMRQVLGMAVFSGMLGVTLFGIFLTPVFFYVIEGFVERHPLTWLKNVFGRLRLSRRTKPQVALGPMATAVDGHNGNGAAHKPKDRVPTHK